MKQYKTKKAIAYGGYVPAGSTVSMPEKQALAFGEAYLEEVTATPEPETPKTPESTDTNADSTNTDLELMTVAELKALADEAELEYPSNVKKAELIELISESEGSDE